MEITEIKWRAFHVLFDDGDSCVMLHRREWSQLMDADLELAGDITTLKNELLPRLLGKLNYSL